VRTPKLLHTESFTSKKFRPYALAIGQLALAWNDLHEGFAILFWDVLRDFPTANAVWNSARFDRAQRDMLRASVAVLPADRRAKFPRFVGDIEWALSQADKIEDSRNDAIHAPLFYFQGGTGIAFDEPSRVQPSTITDHPRALKLQQKELLPEFRWARDASLVLRDFLARIMFILRAGKGKWPARPVLPARPHRAKAATQSRTR